MPRVFLSFPVSNSDNLSITGENARYLNSVLRIRKGDSLVLFDIKGEHFDSHVTSVSRGKVDVKVTASLGTMRETEGGVVLALGLLKGAKMKLVIQKAVELGVSAIIPLETQRTVVKDTRKLDRWKKIALEAARQCGRPSPPPVEPPVSLKDFFESAGHSLQGVVFYEGDGLEPLSSEDFSTVTEGGTIVAVGPEGGFTSTEIELMVSKGLKARTLGRNILRAETAAIAAVTLAQYLTGRLGSSALDKNA